MTTLAIDCIQSPWNAAFQSQRGRGPVVEVELPVDQTGEAIGTAALAQQARKLLRAAGMNSAPGQAPDHVLTGVLLSLHDGRLDRDDAVVQSYLLGLSLVEVESGAKVWMDLFHLRKLVTAGGGKRSRSVTVVMQAVNLDANEKVWMKVETVRKLVGRPGAPPQA